MVKIRLTKTGRKNAPSFRIVVTDSRSPRDGKFIEVIGYFNPSHNPTLVQIDKKKYEEWVKKGAKPTEAVLSIVDGKYTYTPYDPKAILEAKEKQKAELENAEKSKASNEVDQAEDTASTTEKTEDTKESPKEEEKQQEVPTNRVETKE